MSTRNPHLPPHGRAKFITDGGLETTLIFHDGIDLPHFASFDLLKTPEDARTSRPITNVTLHWPRKRSLASSLKARPGVPIATGETGSVMTPQNWPR